MTADLSSAQRAAELTGLGGFAVWQVEQEGLIPLTVALRPDHLIERFEATRAGLASGSGLTVEQVPARTAVSASQVGLVSRLWSVALASVALHDRVPDLRADTLLVSDTHRNPSPMALADPDAGRLVGGVTEAVAALDELVVRGAVVAVTDACRRHGRTSATVLVSNAASSLVAATRVLGRKVPARATHLEAITRRLLDLPWLADGGGYRPAIPDHPVTPDHPGTPEHPATPDHPATPVHPSTQRGGEEFKRTGCCLYYRLPGHGLCPDCVLVRPGHPADDHH